MPPSPYDTGRLPRGGTCLWPLLTRTAALAVAQCSQRPAWPCSVHDIMPLPEHSSCLLSPETAPTRPGCHLRGVLTLLSNAQDSWPGWTTAPAGPGPHCARSWGRPVCTRLLALHDKRREGCPCCRTDADSELNTGRPEPAPPLHTFLLFGQQCK